MHFLARLALIAAAFGLLLIGVCHTRPAWLANLRLDVWSLPELWEKIEEQKERHQVLSTAPTLTQERARRKEEATMRLIAGELSLTAAAAVYRDLSDHIPAFGDYLRHTWPSQSPAERLCRYAIQGVEWVLRPEPEKARAVTDRLQAELEDLLRSDNGLTLP